MAQIAQAVAKRASSCQWVVNACIVNESFDWKLYIHLMHSNALMDCWWINVAGVAALRSNECEKKNFVVFEFVRMRIIPRKVCNLISILSLSLFFFKQCTYFPGRYVGSVMVQVRGPDPRGVSLSIAIAPGSLMWPEPTTNRIHRPSPWRNVSNEFSKPTHGPHLTTCSP